MKRVDHEIIRVEIGIHDGIGMTYQCGQEISRYTPDPDSPVRRGSDDHLTIIGKLAEMTWQSL
ncbi:MAG: hypothetical protein IPK94_00320 [Saprospiraceae bacterium]|nr:hypothetical protein [Saprospiraceae bacterium]